MRTNILKFWITSILMPSEERFHSAGGIFLLCQKNLQCCRIEFFAIQPLLLHRNWFTTLLATFIKIVCVISFQKRWCMWFFMLHQTLEEQDRETHLNLHKDCKLLFQSNSEVVCPVSRHLIWWHFCILSITCTKSIIGVCSLKREKWLLLLKEKMIHFWTGSSRPFLHVNWVFYFFQ